MVHRWRLQDGSCGIKYTTRTGVGGVREVDLYVQHDSFVQQVIDEQFLVQCWPDSPEGRVSYQNKKRKKHQSSSEIVRDVTVTSKFAGKRKKKTEENPDRIVLRPGTVESVLHDEKFVSNLVDSNMDVIAESPRWVDKSSPSDMMAGEEDGGGAAMSEAQPTLSGWMELEGVEEDDLMIGDNVTLVVRLRQSGDQDAMISSCSARGGDNDVGEQRKAATAGPKQDLTDYRGCVVDETVFGDFHTSFNIRTGVKVSRSSFPIFKFSGFPELILECSVLVCRKSCRAKRCDEGEELSSTGITHKFNLSTRVSVAGSSIRRSKKQHSNDEYVVSPASLVNRAQSSALEPAAASSLLREKEMNEVEEAYIEQQIRLEETEKMLCLSPSRLILAFGVILFILLLALVFACMLWMRARAQSRRPKPGKQSLPPPPPPAMIARPHPGAVPQPPPGVHGTVRRGPAYFIRGRMPYIRVVH